MWQLPLKLPPKVRQQNSSGDFERKTSSDMARTLSDMDENMSETFGVRCSRRVASRLLSFFCFRRYAVGPAMGKLDSRHRRQHNKQGARLSIGFRAGAGSVRCQVDCNFDCNSMVPMGRDDQSAQPFDLPGLLAAALREECGRGTHAVDAACCP